MFNKFPRGMIFPAKCNIRLPAIELEAPRQSFYFGEGKCFHNLSNSARQCMAFVS